MKVNKIDDFNIAVAKFSKQVASFEDEFSKESPELWQAVLSSMVNLTNISILLNVAIKKQTKEKLDFYNQVAKQNGLNPISMLKDENDIDIDISNLA